jgi:hypothetical protein
MLRAFGMTAIGAVALSAGGAWAQNDDFQCPLDSASPVPFCIVKETGLPLRLLVKPQSNKYIDMDENSAPEPLEAFEVLNVFEMIDVEYDADNFSATGWFRVGSGLSQPDGYVRAEDVVIWKQALALAYTNPGVSQRKPVLMFESRDALNETLVAIESGDTTADQIYEEVALGPPNVPDGIVSRENSSWVNIDDTFYLLPILNYDKEFAYFWPDGDLLGVQLAALTNQGRSDQVAACDLQDAGANDCLKAQAGGGLTKAALDVKFVIDTTLSMQPYIDAVRNAIRTASQQFEERLPNEDALKFGVVGYRDAVESSPGLEYVAKNFTPELLDGQAFRDLLDSGVVAASLEGSGDLAEEVFAGLQEAITSPWSPDTPRAIILIGDAASHPIGHEKNTTGLSEIAVRELADQENVAIAAIYIGDPNSQDGLEARPQFEAMAAGDGETNIAFSTVDSGAAESLEASLRDVIERIVEFLGEGRADSIAGEGVPEDNTVGGAIAGAVRAAFVDYIGDEAVVPSNIVAWALDRDPTNYDNKAFDVKVMVTRGDLQQLMDLLDGLLTKFQEGQTTSVDFLAGAQAAGAATSFDLQIADTDKIQESGLVPTWIKSLPYKSDILALSVEEFRQAPPDERTRIEQKLTSLIEFYDGQLNNVDVWVDLNRQASPEDRVYMLDLSNLP